MIGLGKIAFDAATFLQPTFIYLLNLKMRFPDAIACGLFILYIFLPGGEA